MRKLTTIVLLLITNIIFCQQNKASGTIEKISAFTDVEKKFDKDIKLKLIVDNDAKCVIKTNHTVELESGFYIEEGGYFHIESADESIAKQPIEDNLFSIYPNPSNSSISISATKSQIAKVAVISLEGKQVFEIKTMPAQSYDLDVSSFSNGVYIMNIEASDGTTVTQKFIKG